MSSSTISQLGPLMIDIGGTSLSEEDIRRLRHPLVGGVILFSRNYAAPQQLADLCATIHALREPRLPIAVDHEGGRVQRFRDGFTKLPAMRCLGEWWDREPRAAVEAARGVGYVLAAELRTLGVDLSFTPVLDLDYGSSSVIGDRALHSHPDGVIAVAGGLIEGLHAAGMAACGKHFPGHGFVAADSHVAIPVDERSLAKMERDLEPYRRLRLDCVMPAHVIYPEVDKFPTGFSKVWLRKLREDFCFDGVVFSDDLSMEGASVAGGIMERAEAAWQAGCDMLLVCNAPNDLGTLLEDWKTDPDPARSRRVARLLTPLRDWRRKDLLGDPNYLAGLASISAVPG